MENGDIVNGVTLIEKHNGKYSDNGSKISTWKCHCGIIFEYCHSYIATGHTKSCGCLKYGGNRKKEMENGDVINGITLLIKNNGNINNDNRKLSTFQCFCGNEFETRLYAVQNLRTKSCGCFKNSTDKLKFPGDEYNNIVLIEKHIGKIGKSQSTSIFLCYCGKNFENVHSYVETNRVKSCGCAKPSANHEIGKIYNGIEIISTIDRKSPQGSLISLCKCICDKEFEAINSQVKEGRIKSCGCLKFRWNVGEKYNNIEILEILEEKIGRNATVVLAKCYCGKEFTTRASLLKTGYVKSCGCHIETRRIQNKMNAEVRIASCCAEFSKGIFSRDNFKCIICNSTQKLNAHHLNGFNWCIEGRYDINNGVTLCKNGCHKEFHSLYGYGDNTKEQFIEFYLNKSYFYNV